MHFALPHLLHLTIIYLLYHHYYHSFYLVVLFLNDGPCFFIFVFIRHGIHHGEEVRRGFFGDFHIGAAILRSLGFTAVRLMTNNPGKVAAMEATGVRVAERVPLIVGENSHNLAYLATKAKKSGHLL